MGKAVGSTSVDNSLESNKILKVTSSFYVQIPSSIRVYPLKVHALLPAVLFLDVSCRDWNTWLFYSAIPRFGRSCALETSAFEALY